MMGGGLCTFGILLDYVLDCFSPFSFSFGYTEQIQHRVELGFA